jgi:L-ascorbate metabolism protein UlaG (beta-lactamase superfamily)
VPVTLRWLGVAGIEIVSDKQTLLIDPYLSRVPIWKSYFGRIQPDPGTAEKVQRADLILVTHSHFDHLLDVPEITRRTGAKVYGSENTCKLLSALGVPPKQVLVVKPWDSLALGDMDVDCFPFEHARVPGYGCGPLPRNLTPPLRARDYRMDYGLCYRIEADGVSVLTDPGYRPDVNIPTSVLLTQPYHSEAYYRQMLPLIQPKTVIPIHWDNLFSHDDTRPYFRPPEFRWPPLRRIDLDEFKAAIQALSPSTNVLIPKKFEAVKLG